MADRLRYAKDADGLAFLRVDSVRASDGGQYRCREDFDHSPTRNAFVQLNVISKCAQPVGVTAVNGCHATR